MLLSHKNKEILPFVKTGMDLENNMLIKKHIPNVESQVLYDLIYVWKLRK